MKGISIALGLLVVALIVEDTLARPEAAAKKTRSPAKKNQRKNAKAAKGKGEEHHKMAWFKKNDHDLWLKKKVASFHPCRVMDKATNETTCDKPCPAYTYCLRAFADKRREIPAIEGKEYHICEHKECSETDSTCPENTVCNKNRFNRYRCVPDASKKREKLPTCVEELFKSDKKAKRRVNRKQRKQHAGQKKAGKAKATADESTKAAAGPSTQAPAQPSTQAP